VRRSAVGTLQLGDNLPASFTAEAGKIYYFRVRLTDQNNSGKGGVNWALDLESIDGDQGQFLIASYGFSTYRQRK
jgi:hypothetical protein